MKDNIKINKEIKEILDNFEKYEARYKLRNETQFIITYREILILLDYITNLQQKYEEIDNDRHILFEQKEKAIEYIKENWVIDEPVKFKNDLLNILKGE